MEEWSLRVAAGSSLRSPPEAESPQSALREQGGRLVQVRGAGSRSPGAGLSSAAAPRADRQLHAAAWLGVHFLGCAPLTAFPHKGLCQTLSLCGGSGCWTRAGPAWAYPGRELSRLSCPWAARAGEASRSPQLSSPPSPPPTPAAWSSGSLFPTSLAWGHLHKCSGKLGCY